MQLSVIIDIISVSVLILGLVFGLIQLRQYRLSQNREASLHLLNSFQTTDFLHGIWIIQELPAGLSKKEIEERVGSDIRLILLVISNWESLGILVFNREITIEMVDDAYSAPIIVSWQKLEKYITDMRNDLKRNTPFEWFQWLVDRMKEREKLNPPVPAYIAHRDWD